MKSISEFYKTSLKISSLNSIWGGTEIPTTVGDAKNPQYSDVIYDRDDSGTWSEGDSYKLTKLTKE